MVGELIVISEATLPGDGAGRALGAEGALFAAPVAGPGELQRRH